MDGSQNEPPRKALTTTFFPVSQLSRPPCPQLPFRASEVPLSHREAASASISSLLVGRNSTVTADGSESCWSLVVSRALSVVVQKRRDVEICPVVSPYLFPELARTMIMEKTRPTMGDIYSQAEKILNQKVRKGTYCVQQDVLEPRSGFVEDEKCKKCGGVDHPRLKHEKDDRAIAVVHKRHDCPIHAPNPKRDKP